MWREKGAALVVLVLALVVVGCIVASQAAYAQPPEDATWLSPGKVQVGNFYPGARAEWPITVHNGNEYITETEFVATGPGEYSATISIGSPLFGDFSDVQFESDYPGDNPTAMSYSSGEQEIVVTGLAEAWTRILTTTYKYYAAFELSYRYPDRVEDGYAYPTPEVQSWVIVTDPTPVMMPKETRDIMVVVDMPVGATAPGQRWEFWVSVKDASQAGTVQTEICSRWLIQMQEVQESGVSLLLVAGITVGILVASGVIYALSKR